MIKVKQLETTMDGWFAWQWYMVVVSTTNTTPGIQIVNGKMRSYSVRWIINYKSFKRKVWADLIGSGKAFHELVTRLK